MRTASWASRRGAVDVQLLALDIRGQPISGQTVELIGRQTQTISTRKRLVGGFYAYDNRVERKDLGRLCSGQTEAKGLLACKATLDAAGQVEPGSAGPAFDERGFDAMRRYFAFMPRGVQVIECTLRLNNPVRFGLPPSRVEAMYAPEQFGEAPNAPLDVKP